MFHNAIILLFIYMCAVLAGRGRKKGRNVLTRMAAMKGPLAVLSTCMDKKTNVKVSTTFKFFVIFIYYIYMLYILILESY